MSKDASLSNESWLNPQELLVESAESCRPLRSLMLDGRRGTAWVAWVVANLVFGHSEHSAVEQRNATLLEQ